MDSERRQRKKARTRSSIYRAAMALFRDRGFEAVTLEEICRDADVARGTFFQHFSSKASLLSAWSQELADELLTLLEGHRRGALGEYRTLVDWLGQRCSGPPDLLAALLAELLQARGREVPPLIQALEAVAQRGQERGELRSTISPRLGAWLLLAGSAAISASAICEADKQDAARGELLLALLSGQREPKPRVAWKPSTASPS